MIVIKTPLRIGFAGGGSDLPAYIDKKYSGWCINATIDKYVYVLVKKRHDNKIYLKYSENEIVDNVCDIKHDFIRETLKFLDINYGVEIINFADIPTKGTGLGSSSSFLVGLLNALHILNGNPVEPRRLAEQACYIEIDRCNKPMGYQDQFAAAFGGLNIMQFNFNGPTAVGVSKLDYSDQELRDLSEHIMMYYTGITRNSSDILSEQSENMNTDKLQGMHDNVRIAQQLAIDLADRKFNSISKAMNKNWILKKQFANEISNENIDRMLEVAMHNGAPAGKVTGAGGGGFLLLYVHPNRRAEVANGMRIEYPDLKLMPVKLDKYGTRVLLNTEEYQWG